MNGYTILEFYNVFTCCFYNGIEKQQKHKLQKFNKKINPQQQNKKPISISFICIL